MVGGFNEDFEWPVPPSFNFNNPAEINVINGKQIASLIGASSDPNKYFWRNLIWSPNGTHLLAQSDDHHLDLFELKQDDEKENKARLEHVFSIHSPTTLLSFAWYPFARQDEPQTWCFIISAKDVTIRLVDAFQGNTRATYGIMDHTERFKGAQAMVFSLDGTKLYCAYDGFLSIIQLDQPGINNHSTMRLTASPRAIKKGKANAGQRGLISCITITNDSSTGNEILAIGTYSGNVGIYQITDPLAKMGEDACMLGWKEEKSNGIAQLSFHPTSPHILFVNSRRDPDIRAYDLRYVGSRRSFLHPAAEVGLLGILRCRDKKEEKEFDINLNSQQRIFFHLDWAGRYLISGDGNGKVRVWDVANPESSNEVENVTGSMQNGIDHFFGRILRPGEDAQITSLFEWNVARDAIPAVAFHPLKSLLILGSGSRTWPLQTPKEGDLSDDENSGTKLEYVVKESALHLFELS